MRRSPTRTRAAATERCVWRTGSENTPTHASASGNAPSFPDALFSFSSGISSAANALFFPFFAAAGLLGSCAAMSRSRSSVFGYRASASVVRSASISRTAISPAAPPSTSPCVPRLPRVSAPRTPPSALFPTSARAASSGSSLASSGSHRMNEAYCRSCLGYPLSRSGNASTGSSPSARSAAALASACRSSGSTPIVSS